MTTTSVTELADFAELAVVSYALLDQGFSREVLKGQANMTDTQAANFLLKYDLVHHTPNNVVGFSATVFREKATDKLIFAARGTEIPTDIPADLLLADVLQISPSGYAKTQATSMYRYWKELTTVGGAAVSYSESEIQQLYAVSKGLTGLLMLDVSTNDYMSFQEQKGSASINFLSQTKCRVAPASN